MREIDSPARDGRLTLPPGNPLRNRAIAQVPIGTLELPPSNHPLVRNPSMTMHASRSTNGRGRLYDSIVDTIGDTPPRHTCACT
jgi:hypothetical protein